MQRRTLVAGVVVSGILAGCQPQPKVVEPEMQVQTVQAACEEVPPKIVEVAVPVPMPCQLQPDPVFDAPVKRTRNGKKLPVQRVATKVNGSGGVNSVQEYIYMPGALYQAYVGVNTATTVLLQPGEYFHQAVIGDKAKWSTSEIAAGSPQGERGGVVVTCAEAGAKSNLTIAASKRVYLLELHCQQSTYHAQISWSYPEEGGVGLLKGMRTMVPAPPAEPPVITAAAPSRATYTIESNRPVAWQPTHVYDTGVEGKQTYIIFPPALATGDAPVVYVRTDEKTQAVTNYRVKQGYWFGDRIYNAQDLHGKIGGLGEPVTYYQVDQIAQQLELRVGEKKPAIVKLLRQGPAF